ncbi:DUF3267 domain-containing protein [Dictyobacter aurantiacus]|uniref:DUF3267 domain-containing protein n=1 Tax=Dictyobacter aurantiacus TaxID=1936993 RepID=A0A401ZGI0_9CHLR|nr:DUF3267 domain-containing protein [Dictyobacter aurantiacus]GCE05985.1 hypothetical protein KDAU_33140 [Dictyobacter aurantiacus]
MALILVDRFHSRKRDEQQRLIDADQLQKMEELALLEGEQLRPLALLSLQMFIVGGLFFVVLDLLSYHWHYQTWLAPLSALGILRWIILNVVGYLLILCVHELIHGVVFAFWGGRPHFGARLPLALYCGASQQLFRRDHYLAVGLAPLIFLTLLGIIVTIFYPGPASYLLFAFAGNFSGAAGDVVVARRVARLPKPTLIEDTEVGYTAWKLPE